MAASSVSGPGSVDEGDVASFAVTIGGTIKSAPPVYFFALAGKASFGAVPDGLYYTEHRLGGVKIW